MAAELVLSDVFEVDENGLSTAFDVQLVQSYFRSGFDSVAIASFLDIDEPDVVRILHGLRNRRRRLSTENRRRARG